MKSTVVQQLAYRDWRGVNRQEELLTAGGREVGDGRVEGWSEIADAGQAASLTSDVDGTGSSSLLKPDAHWHL